MTDRTYGLGTRTRQIVLESMVHVCAHRRWELLAAHVRTMHVHVVVSGSVAPENILHDLKAYASRALNGSQPPSRRWTRHGSTRYLWTRADVDAAVDYVVYRQGEAMAVYSASAYPRSITVAAP